MLRGILSVMVIVVGNGISDPSSNPGQVIRTEWFLALLRQPV